MLLQAYDHELRNTLSAERATALRAAATNWRGRRAETGLRVRLGTSLVRAGLRLAPEARPHGTSPAHPAVY